MTETTSTGPAEPAATPPGQPDRQLRRERRAWYTYDWANSAFYTTVIVVFLGPYLTSVAENAKDANGLIHPLGLNIRPEAFYPYIVSLSVLLSVFTMPIAGALADRTQRKRELIAVCAAIGSAATMGLGTVEGDEYLLGGVLFVIANVAFATSVVVYNSFLPDLADADERDKVSSRGWALGYIGGGLLLAGNLALFTSASALGLSQTQAVQFSLFSAGAWWATFAGVSVFGLRNRLTDRDSSATLSSSIRHLLRGFASLRLYPKTLLFLAAYLLYNDGIQTVIAMSSVYGAQELGLPNDSLITAILVVQFLAFFGALLLGWTASRFGAKRTLLVAIVVWMATLGGAWLLPPGQPLWFFALAMLIGTVLGGSQALSRSVFSQLIPAGREAEYFSIYEISDKGTSWLGPLIFGLTFDLTGSYRTSIISLAVLFAAGLALLAATPLRAAIVAAGNTPPNRM